MKIKFKVIFSNGNVTFIEYIFDSWNDFIFDMLHYNQDGARIDSKTVANFSVRKAIRNLVTRGKKNNAIITITERNSNYTENEIHI